MNLDDSALAAAVGVARGRLAEDIGVRVDRQFDQGLKTIHEALRSAIREKGLPLAHIAYTVEGTGLQPRDTTFIVAATNTLTESLMFTRSEIMDSAQSIDLYANAKVRVLLSRLAGRYNFPAFNTSTEPRYIVLWDLQWRVLDCQRLEPAANLSDAMAAAIERLETDGWSPNGSAKYGFVFIRRGGTRRLLMLTSQDPYETSPQSFSPPRMATKWASNSVTGTSMEESVFENRSGNGVPPSTEQGVYRLYRDRDFPEWRPVPAPNGRGGQSVSQRSGGATLDHQDESRTPV